MTGRSRSQPRIETVAVAEREEAARRRRQAEPAGAEDAQQVAVREDQDVAVRPSGAGELTRSARAADLVDGLAARPRPGPDRPVRDTRPGCRRSAGPRARRSPTPCRSGSGSPARRSRRGGRSRRRGTAGLVRTSANGWPASRRPSAPACVAPGRRSAGCRSGRCAGRGGPTRSRRGGRARPAARRRVGSVMPSAGDGSASAGRPGPADVGRVVAPGPARRTRAAASRRSAARSARRDLRDPGVVAVDLVVVELATVRDHPLQPLDLVLEVLRRSPRT